MCAKIISNNNEEKPMCVYICMSSYVYLFTVNQCFI